MSDDLVATLRAIIERLERLGLSYMVVGSIAALAHGRSRSTQDFDVVVELDHRGLHAFLDALPKERFYVSPEAAAEAMRASTLFKVIDMVTGWKVDVVPLKQRAFSQREFARRIEVTVLGVRAFVASVEDTILAKLEWSKLGGGSGRQREDVRELLALHEHRIDVAYVERGVHELGLEGEWRAVQAEGE